MSNAIRFTVLVGLILLAAVIAQTTGTFGLGLPMVAVAAIVGVVALAVAPILTRRGTGDAAAPRRRTRDPRPFALAGLGLAVLALLVMVLVAQEEARDHAFLHYLFGAIELGLFAAVAWTWRPDPATAGSALRGVLLIALGVSAAAAFLESIGAAGFDRLNVGHRIEWLTTLHSVTAPVGAIGVLAIPLSVVALVFALARRGRTRQPSERR